ncbi:MAG: hypothetical protein R8K46_06825 [Mariprofundaceae bacterium]
MNIKKIILIIAAMASVLMLLFPPTIFFIPEVGDQPAAFRFEYLFVFSIPEDVRINGILLLSQWFGLLLITGIVMSFFPSADPTRIDKTDDKPEENAANEEGKAEQDAR